MQIQFRLLVKSYLATTGYGFVLISITPKLTKLGQVTLKQSIVDTYGQNLDEEATIVFPVTPPTNVSLSLSQQGAYGFLSYGSQDYHNNFPTHYA